MLNLPTNSTYSATMDVTCTLIELKPGSTERVNDWASFLHENHADALATLGHEGVTVESAFLVQIEGKDYLIGYMRAADISKAAKAVETSTSPVDKYHQSFKRECWGTRHRCQLLSDLSRIPDEESLA